MTNEDASQAISTKNKVDGRALAGAIATTTANPDENTRAEFTATFTYVWSALVGPPLTDTNCDDPVNVIIDALRMSTLSRLACRVVGLFSGNTCIKHEL